MVFVLRSAKQNKIAGTVRLDLFTKITLTFQLCFVKPQVNMISVIYVGVFFFD